jgi:hypothetical protein
VSERDWRDDVIDAANKAGLNASRDCPDSILMADNRNLCPPGSIYDSLADSLAADLEKKAPEPVTRATCAALVRAAANLQGLALLGLTTRECLAVLGFAAAKLEMRTKP